MGPAALPAWRARDAACPPSHAAALLALLGTLAVEVAVGPLGAGGPEQPELLWLGSLWRGLAAAAATDLLFPGEVSDAARLAAEGLLGTTRNSAPRRHGSAGLVRAAALAGFALAGAR